MYQGADKIRILKNLERLVLPNFNFSDSIHFLSQNITVLSLGNSWVDAERCGINCDGAAVISRHFHSLRELYLRKRISLLRIKLRRRRRTLGNICRATRTQYSQFVSPKGLPSAQCILVCLQRTSKAVISCYCDGLERVGYNQAKNGPQTPWVSLIERRRFTQREWLERTIRILAAETSPLRIG